MQKRPVLVTEDDVKSLIEWNPLFDAIKGVMMDVSLKSNSTDNLIVQPARSFMKIPHKNAVMLMMPGLSERNKVLSCKIVTSFVDNPSKYNLPSIMANVFVFDTHTGKLKAVLEGTTITEWRTAAASAVATHYLKPEAGKNETLAVIGAGAQGRIHIIAFKHFFNFKKVNLWNRTHSKALKLAEDLKNQYDIDIEVFDNIDDCVRDADVIVTATYSSNPLLKLNQIKKNVIINAIGAGIKHHCELDDSIYEKSSIYTDSMENARVELKGLIEEGYPVLGEIGEIIIGKKEIVKNDVIIFHSLGMGLEDGVTARLILEKYSKNN
ncbi:ornithine cyclodeaminase, putative [Pediculus humanus corporis]|uniref:Ketimine reductase mu-crystallin n=1 Tax=Pediculus humanus subsp. corporis TaxID=121224 RepID=E0VHW9_PEDHC|nr:ornithine cyclodeaminase, putative [Pediculus humanus corporis]EEB12975.1 ornithine cyclodeaminase, putative [Pediculus humanus corporis]